MAALNTFKLQGQTSGSVAIATVDVVQWPDGSFRWSPSTGGEPVIIREPEAIRLLGKVFNVKITGYPG